MELTFDFREFWEKTKKIIRSPEAFYKGVEKEKGWKDAFSYSIAIAVVASLIGVLEISVLYPVFQSALPSIFAPQSTPQILDILPALFVSAVVVVLLGFVWAGALHFWLRLWKIKGDFASAYKAYTYSRAPNSLLGWIPYVGGLFGLYSIYVLVVGISVHYKISKKKSFLLLIGPLLLLFVLQVLFFAAVSNVAP